MLSFRQLVDRAMRTHRGKDWQAVLDFLDDRLLNVVRWKADPDLTERDTQYLWDFVAELTPIRPREQMHIADWFYILSMFGLVPNGSDLLKVVAEKVVSFEHKSLDFPSAAHFAQYVDEPPAATPEEPLQLSAASQALLDGLSQKEQAMYRGDLHYAVPLPT